MRIMVDHPQPRLDHVSCLRPEGLYRMAYWTWGEEGCDHVVVCVHGLSRQGRDFDNLARALCAHGQVRVVCPDVLGRGRSEWLRDPTGYQVPAYVADMVTLLARLRARTLDWVGTSMGGLIGMGLAALPGQPLRRLVLNDVGPALAADALDRIAGYLGRAPRFSDKSQALAYLAQISAGFGPHTAAQWEALNAHMLVPEQGSWRLHYDPAIAMPVRAMTAQSVALGEAALWAAYDRITCETLLLRGALSDLLLPGTAQAMSQRGPCARVREIAGVGHAPTFMNADQVALVRNFILDPAQQADTRH